MSHRAGLKHSVMLGVACGKVTAALIRSLWTTRPLQHTSMPLQLGPRPFSRALSSSRKALAPCTGRAFTLRSVARPAPLLLQAASTKMAEVSTSAVPAADGLAAEVDALRAQLASLEVCATRQDHAPHPGGACCVQCVSGCVGTVTAAITIITPAAAT